MDLSSYLWEERYRPKTIEDVVMPENFREKFRKFVSDQQIPNLLFEGPPGSGKTTCAKILCSPAGVLKHKENVLETSGSSKKTRGIDYVDNIIQGFVKNPPIGNDKIRIVFIDEADNMSPDAYKELRSLVNGEFLKTARFLFTCNYPSNIPEPVRSRFVSYKFKQISKEYVLEYCSNILKSEKVTFNSDVVSDIIKLVYPDIRRIVSILQDNSFNGKLNIDPSLIKIHEKEVITLYKNIILTFQQAHKDRMKESMNSLINIITNNEVDFPEVYQRLFQEIPKAPLKIVINKYCNSHKDALVPWMHFQAMIYESLSVLHQQIVLSKKLQGINTYQKG